MKKTLLLFSLFAVLALTACATTTPQPNLEAVGADIHAANVKTLAGATLVNKAADKVIKRAGPVVVTGICVFQPQYCEPAKVAYGLALATHEQITQTIAALNAVSEADQGTKLATLYQQFQLNIGNINNLIARYGGDPLDMTEFNAMVAAAQVTK